MTEKRGYLRIVLVEDNPADAYLVELALEAVGLLCKLVRFDDGDSAVRGLSEMQESGDSPVPDLIFLDLNLPFLGGLDVLRYIRQAPSLKRVPVAILTSSDSQADRREAERNGADRYILKKANANEFFASIDRTIRELLCGHSASI